MFFLQHNSWVSLPWREFARFRPKFYFWWVRNCSFALPGSTHRNGRVYPLSSVRGGDYFGFDSQGNGAYSLDMSVPSCTTHAGVDRQRLADHAGLRARSVLSFFTLCRGIESSTAMHISNLWGWCRLLLATSTSPPKIASACENWTTLFETVTIPLSTCLLSLCQPFF